MNKVNENKNSSGEATLSPRPALACRACGTEERIIDLGGTIRLTNIAPLNRLCVECMKLAVCP